MGSNKVLFIYEFLKTLLRSKLVIYRLSGLSAAVAFTRTENYVQTKELILAYIQSSKKIVSSNVDLL